MRLSLCTPRVVAGWFRRRRRDAEAVKRAEERARQTQAERHVSSGDLTALKSDHRAARIVLEPNVGEAERLAKGDEPEAAEED